MVGDLCLQEAGILRYELHLMLTLGNKVSETNEPWVTEAKRFQEMCWR